MFFHLNMGKAEKLVVALGGLLRKIPFYSLLDIARCRLVSLNEIRVVAVHLPDEGRQLVLHPLRMHMTGEPTRSLEDLAGKVLKPRIAALGNHRLH